ncbi:hypothetical protein GALMADRAFT_250638 [Galerina marginata CBS 339.88]|uniref:Uncharacterized protein n=1 Tax=Galerina marginata (strain CBS 339.88) TaxID=685588 RepID=A0A067T216_GALM3|nr:hypothetical protein GALMADRAFT_250638 [Galerina marginata CBS 339.88]
MWRQIGIHVRSLPFSPSVLCCIHITSPPKGSTMSHIEHSLSPTAIPGAMSACRQMTALNALSFINLFSCFGFLIAVGGVNFRKFRTSNRAQGNINNDRPQDDNEVDLRMFARCLHLFWLTNATSTR